jgi:hypothetical protein
VRGLSPRGVNLAEALQCGLLTDLAYRSHRQGASFIRVNGHDPTSQGI